MLMKPGPGHLESLLGPSRGNLRILHLDPPLWLVGDVLDELEHAPLADGESDSTPAFIAQKTWEGLAILGPVVVRQA